MSEIEKMYRSCEIKKQQTCSHSDTCYDGSLGECEGCNAYQYPPFTAEKQLELIIFIINKFGTLTFFDYEKFTRETMAEKLAKLLNSRWQDLSDMLKQQVKGILE